MRPNEPVRVQLDYSIHKCTYLSVFRKKDGRKKVERGTKDGGRRDERLWKEGIKTMEGRMSIRTLCVVLVSEPTLEWIFLRFGEGVYPTTTLFIGTTISINHQRFGEGVFPTTTLFIGTTISINQQRFGEGVYPTSTLFIGTTISINHQRFREGVYPTNTLFIGTTKSINQQRFGEGVSTPNHLVHRNYNINLSLS